MKKTLLTLTILLLCFSSAIYSQVTFSAPTFIRSYGPTHGDWMDDATDPSGKLWVMQSYSGSTSLIEYSSMPNLLAGIVNFTYVLPFTYAGTGHIVYGGNLYYNKEGTNNLIKYNLATQTLLLDVPLPGAYSMNTGHYNWGGYSDIDFAVDQTGLWVMYTNLANSGKLVVSKLNPSTLVPTSTWNTNSEVKTSMGNAFIINGIVYCIDDYAALSQTVNYAYNTATSTGSITAIPWTNGSSYMTSMQYNPTTNILYEWNNDNLYTHSVLGVTNITTTVSVGPYCAGSSINVPYTILGTFNPGNIFTAQLSDASGSFVSAVNIGSLTSITNGTISATIPSITSTSSLYQIRVIASNPITIGASNGLNITINALPTVSVTSGSICSGQSFTMIPSGASTYSYTGGSAVVTPTVTTNYNVTGTNTLGCVSSNTAVSTVTVIAGPTISASTPNSIICAGETAVLTVSTSATSYTWNTGATTISISVTPTVTTLYTVNGANTVGCMSSANVNVTVNACTGINELTASLISVYPNPNNGIVNISLTAALAQNSILEIYDALGKLVVKQFLTNELNVVNISHLDNGIYIFKVLNNNNTVKIGKLIKQ